jgi:L-histidine Nalpha-methyltransferase
MNTDTTLRRRQSFLADVLDDLRRSPKRLRPQYLYDDLGSSLFETICHLPWYPITRAEKRLLEAERASIARLVGNPVTLIELGCGTGEKLELLTEAFVEAGVDLRIELIDVSALALERSRRALAARGPLAVTCRERTYEAGLAEAGLAWSGPGSRLVLFLGSNIGNFDPAEAREFLAFVRGALTRGDHVLLGADLVKPRPVLEAAYDDPLGVTAAFNRNLLVRMDRELGLHFDLAAFAHRACWNPGESRVEMHLVSLADQAVDAPGGAIRLARGETIWTESSYKFTTGQLEAMTGEAGFDTEWTWVDDESPFALTLLRCP